MNIFLLISGEPLLNALFVLVIWACIIGAIWWGWNYVHPPEPWFKVGTVILVLLTVVVLVNILLGLLGHPLVKF